MTHAKIVAPSTSEAMATTSSSSDNLLANVKIKLVRFSLFNRASEIRRLDET